MRWLTLFIDIPKLRRCEQNVLGFVGQKLSLLFVSSLNHVFVICRLTDYPGNQTCHLEPSTANFLRTIMTELLVMLQYSAKVYGLFLTWERG